jgi:hypothetical protein
MNLSRQGLSLGKAKSGQVKEEGKKDVKEQKRWIVVDNEVLLVSSVEQSNDRKGQPYASWNNKGRAER